MARKTLDKNAVICRAAQLANDVGLEKITLKALANDLNIQPPSLYNHIRGLDDLKKELMIYGWFQMEEKIIEAAAGVSGYEALEVICRTFWNMQLQIRAFSMQCFGTTSLKMMKQMTLPKGCFLLCSKSFHR